MRNRNFGTVSLKALLLKDGRGYTVFKSTHESGYTQNNSKKNIRNQSGVSSSINDDDD